MPSNIAQNLHQRLIVNPPLAAFLFGLFWATLAMTVSRYWIVPNYIPSENGHILGDPLLYHNMALEQVNILRDQGWSAFQLHYGAQGTAGITSLLYLIYPSPFLVLILNALLHAVACAAVTRLLTVWFRPGISLLATLPLLISPANIFWLAQINKESYATAGFALFCLGYILALQQSLSDNTKNKLAGWWVLLAVLGIFLMYIPRPHLNQMLILGFVVTSVIVIACLTLKKQYKAMLTTIMQATILTAAFGYFSQGGLSDRVDAMITQAAKEDEISRALETSEETQPTSSSSTDPSANSQMSESVAETTNKSEATIEPLTGTPVSAVNDSASAPGSTVPDNISREPAPNAEEVKPPAEPLGVICYRKLEPANWRPVDWLPESINSRLKALASVRCHNHELHDVHDNPTTKQSIADTDVAIQGVDDMIAYAPRALQLGFFGPLPSQWPSGTFLSSFFFTTVPVMMVLFYIGFVVTAFWIVKTKAWLVLPIFMISTVPLWIYGISTSFLGALFRYRYPMWIVLFCICTAGLLTVLTSRFARDDPAHK